MKRKKFIQTSLLATGTLLTGMNSCLPKKSKEAPRSVVSKLKRRNWGRNITFKANDLKHPATIEEVRELMSTGSRKKGLGSTHSYNDIADSPKAQISLRKLNKIVAIDKSTSTVTIEGGARYEDIVVQLHVEGYALHNMASLPQITVAGACVTGTHGSGTDNGSLPTAVNGVEMCLPGGDMMYFSRDKNPDVFDGVVVNLGGIGLITRLDLEVMPTFDAFQNIYLDLPIKNVINHFDEIMASGYSVSLFTKWQNDIIDQVWIKQRSDGATTDFGTEFFGGSASDRNVHPIIDLSAESCTDQMGEIGPWYERLPHFKINAMPSAFDELQSEYFVPVSSAADAIQAIAGLGDLMAPHLYISEVRTIAADDLWMSPLYKRPSVAFHFTWKPHWPEVKKILPVIEERLSPFGVRPHWAKLYTMDPKQIRQSYDKFPDFLALLKTYDPTGTLRNDYLDRVVYS
ncbi:MAG: FAD-binding protein [Cyclobacteriaceae bacterium]|nr:FAD-binding protein [Cyclobacteriaceae bacterium HetDA_MAG_MS6]